MIPYASLILQTPLKFKHFRKFEESRSRITAFCKLLLDHLKSAQSLPPRSLGRAMLDFALLPGITEENVLAEIELMFIAGSIWKVFLYCN